jgi:hypothetical protein
MILPYVSSSSKSKSTAEAIKVKDDETPQALRALDSPPVY